MNFDMHKMHITIIYIIFIEYQKYRFLINFYHQNLSLNELEKFNSFIIDFIF